MKNRKPEYLLVDGYNILHQWDFLKEIARDSLENARRSLLDIIADYNGAAGYELIVVFDAHKAVRGQETSGSDFSPHYNDPVLGRRKAEIYHNIKVVYTNEGETADHLIESLVNRLAKNHKVMIATSDRLEQVVALGQGAFWISGREFWEEIKKSRRIIREEFVNKPKNKRSALSDRLDRETSDLLERMRRGEGIKKGRGEKDNEGSTRHHGGA